MPSTLNLTYRVIRREFPLSWMPQALTMSLLEGFMLNVAKSTCLIPTARSATLHSRQSVIMTVPAGQNGSPSDSSPSSSARLRFRSVYVPCAGRAPDSEPGTVYVPLPVQGAHNAHAQRAQRRTNPCRKLAAAAHEGKRGVAWRWPWPLRLLT